MDKGAKITGLLVFVAGVVMLVAVFVVAYNMLLQSRAAALPADPKGLPQEALALFARVGFLFLLGYIASAVAGRGIQLFEAAGARPDPERVAPREA